MRKKESLIKKIGFLTLLTFFLVVSFHLPLLAEEEEHGETHGHHFHRHHLGVTLAATSHLEKGGSTYFTLGAEYEYRLSPLFGIGLIGELIFGKETEYLFALPFFIHVTESLWFRIAPGLEVAHHSEESGDSHGEENHGNGEHSSQKAKFLTRIGAGYNFNAGGFIITPTIDLDFLRSQTSLVWGITIGRGF
ncbi:hypothetical protein ACFLT2_05965 [Acidobacteriota bacterium]